VCVQACARLGTDCGVDRAGQGAKAAVRLVLGQAAEALNLPR
jgi:hypothetical protein